MRTLHLRSRVLFLGLMALLWSGAVCAHQRSPADCSAEADRASRGQGAVIGGAASGALRGAAFGAIVGGNSRGARRGAAVGGVVGAAHSAHRNDYVYTQVYDDCMRGYSHHH